MAAVQYFGEFSIQVFGCCEQSKRFEAMYYTVKQCYVVTPTQYMIGLLSGQLAPVQERAIPADAQ